MIRAACLAAILAACIGTTALASPTEDSGRSLPLSVSPGAEAPHGLEADLAAAARKYQDNDFAGARALLETIISAPSFAKLGDEQRYWALSLYAWTLLDAREFNKALTATRALTTFDRATAGDWIMRVQASAGAKDKADALASLTTIAQRWPVSLQRFNELWLWQLLWSTRAAPDLADARIGLITALHGAHWAPQAQSQTVDEFWYDLALALLGRGDVEKARAVAEDVTDPEVIADMRIDRRFDRITAKDPEHFDVAKAAARRIAALRTISAAAPNKLDTINTLARKLLLTGDAAGALKLADDAIARARPADGSASPFSDMDQLNWTYDVRADALLALGRGEEALAAMTAGALRPEQGRVNVSQAINLGGVQLALDHSSNAVATIQAVSPADASPYGKMQRETVLAEAYVTLNDDVDLKAHLDYIKAHIADAPLSAIVVLALTGDMDAAARETITLLADADQRRKILSALQERREWPAEPAFSKRLEALMVALRERPDVTAAIDRVGRVETIPLYDE